MESAEKMLKELGVRAKKASRELNRLGVKRKNEGLEAVAKALILHRDKILAANEKDVKKAKENQMKESLVDRLSLTEERTRRQWQRDLPKLWHWKTRLARCRR